MNISNKDLFEVLSRLPDHSEVDGPGYRIGIRRELPSVVRYDPGWDRVPLDIITFEKAKNGINWILVDLPGFKRIEE